MICPRCNSNVNEGSGFCMNCGANLSVVQQVQPTSSINEVPVQQSIENKQTKKKKYWLIPIYVFLTMFFSMLIPLILSLFEIEIPFISNVLKVVAILCGIGFFPSIIIAIALSVKNKYWIIPIYPILGVYCSSAIMGILLKLEIETPFLSKILKVVVALCGIGFLPSIIIAIALSAKNKKNRDK